MAEKPSRPDGDGAAEGGGVWALVSAALNSPAPSTEAEQASQERVRALFHANPPASRTLHEMPSAFPAVPDWTESVGRLLRRLLRR